ncbi:MAG: terminase family protein, partial [Nitrososphaerota archaeon]
MADIEVTPSILAETLINISGAPPDFKSFLPSKFVLDAPKKNLLLKCGRQTGKSSIVTMSMLIDARFKKGFRQGYIAPSSRAATSFSVLRFSDALMSSTALWRSFYSPKNSDKFVIDNVGLKKFKNNSVCVFLYADSDPDRIRGFTFDRIVFDEIQDIDLDAVVPVVEACIMNSMYGEKMFLGTPKSIDNSIELLWSHSKQYEWSVKCEGCNKYNIFISTKTIGKNGPICAYCGKSLNTLNGKFIPMQPDKDIDGFHISRTALPFYMFNKQGWQEIVSLMDNPLWSKEKFDNEILGISSGSGLKMITEKDLRDICTYDVDPYDEKTLISCRGEKFIGIDWGGTDYSSKTENVQSQTAIVVYNL